MTSTAPTAPAAPTTYDVFISHAHADNDRTQQIYQALTAAGLKVWVDLHSVTPSDPLSRVIQTGLDHSKAGVLLLSRASLDSDPCDNERNYFYQNKKPMFVVLLQPASELKIPWYLNNIWYIDLSQDFDGQLAILVNAILGKAELPRLDETELPLDAPQTANATATLLTSRVGVRFAPPLLIGRDDELAILGSWLNDPNRSRGLIRAHGGAGKTALAAEALRLWLKSKTDTFALWISAGRAEADSIFAEIGRVLNHKEQIAMAKGEAQLDVVAELLADKPISAIILDDCWNARALGRTLKAIPNSIPVIITSRQRHVEAATHTIELPDLAPDDAVTMLGYHAGRTLDPAAARAFCAKVGNLAFAVELAGKLLKKRDHWTAADLLKTVDVLTQPRPDSDDPEAGRESVNALIEASLNALEDENAKTVFLAFGAFPSPQLTAELLMQYFIGEPDYDDETWRQIRQVNSQLSHLTEDEFRKGYLNFLRGQPIDPAPADAALITLRDSGLATFVPGTEQRNPAYRVHDLAHTYASTRIDRAAEDRATAACLTLTRRYSQPGWDSFRALLPALDALSGAAARAFEREQWQTAEGFAWGLYPAGGNMMLNYLGYYDLSLRLLTNAAAAAGKQGNARNQGAHLNHLGLVYAGLGRVREAIDYYEQVVEVMRTAGDRKGEGAALGNLGNAYDSLGEYRRAIDYHEQHAAIAREIGDRRGEGNALGNLGIAYDRLGEYRRAIDNYEQILVIQREIGDRQGEGKTLGNLGSAYYSLGEVQRAIEYYEQQLVITREIGDRQGEGNALGSLGLAYYSLGEYRRAIAYLEQALTIMQEIGDKGAQGSILGNLGNAYASLGEYQRAIAYHEQRLAIAREIGDRRGEGNALGNLGTAYASLGEYRRAIEYYEQAVVIRRAIGDRAGEANDLNNLGAAYEDWTDGGDLHKALAYYQQARTIFAQIGQLHNVAHVDRNIARVQAKLSGG